MFDGKQIGDFIERSAMTQGDFAARLSAILGGRPVQQATVSRWIAGKQVPHPDTVRAIAQVLGVQVAELYGKPDIVPVRPSEAAADRRPRAAVGWSDSHDEPRRRDEATILKFGEQPGDLNVIVRDRAAQLLFGDVQGEFRGRLSGVRELAVEIAKDSAAFRPGLDQGAVLTNFLARVFYGDKACPYFLAQHIMGAAEATGYSASVRAELELLFDVQGRISVDSVDELQQLWSSSVVVTCPDPSIIKESIDLETMVCAILNGIAEYTIVISDTSSIAPRVLILAILEAAQSYLARDGDHPAASQTLNHVMKTLLTGNMHIAFAPPNECIVPLVAFGPNSPHSCRLYVSGQFKSDWGSVGHIKYAQLNNKVRDLWLDLVYSRVRGKTLETRQDWVVKYVDEILSTPGRADSK